MLNMYPKDLFCGCPYLRNEFCSFVYVGKDKKVQHELQLEALDK
jgi:hypothetical protein